MKTLITKLSLLLFLSTSISCEKEEPFICEKNAVVNSGGQQCAFARMERTSGQTPDITAFEMGISWSTGGLDISITSDTPLEEGKSYTLQDGASFWFNQLNRRDAAFISISELDKENRTISGDFTVEAEGNSNSQAYDYKTSGTFTKVSF